MTTTNQALLARQGVHCTIVNGSMRPDPVGAPKTLLETHLKRQSGREVSRDLGKRRIQAPWLGTPGASQVRPLEDCAALQNLVPGVKVCRCAHKVLH